HKAHLRRRPLQIALRFPSNPPFAKGANGRPPKMFFALRFSWLSAGVRAHSDRLGAARFTGRAYFVFLVVQRSADEGGEQRVRLERPGFEFGMELATQEPRVLGGFDDFDVVFVRRTTGDAQSSGNENLFVVAVEFVAMAMAFGDFQ